MNGIFWNVALALAWAAVTGDLSLGNLVLGYGLGFCILVLMRQAVGLPDYGRRTLRALGLALFFFVELLKANLQVAYEVLTPRMSMRPAVLAVPLAARTDTEITLLAAMINLTPGTLVIDVADDRSALFVHVLYGDDPEAVRRSLKDGFERRLLEVLR